MKCCEKNGAPDSYGQLLAKWLGGGEEGRGGTGHGSSKPGKERRRTSSQKCWRPYSFFLLPSTPSTNHCNCAGYCFFLFIHNCILCFVWFSKHKRRICVVFMSVYGFFELKKGKGEFPPIWEQCCKALDSSFSPSFFVSSYLLFLLVNTYRLFLVGEMHCWVDQFVS